MMEKEGLGTSMNRVKWLDKSRKWLFRTPNLALVHNVRGVGTVRGSGRHLKRRLTPLAHGRSIETKEVQVKSRGITEVRAETQRKATDKKSNEKQMEKQARKRRGIGKEQRIL